MEEKMTKPKVSQEDVKEILHSHYDIKPLEIVELNAYDDRNYWIKRSVDGDSDCVLKVTNNIDSKCLDMIKAQTNLLKYVSERGFKCPEPLPTAEGELFFTRKFHGTTHVVRLFKFVNGIVLDKAPKLNELYFNVGREIGRLNESMQNFDDTATYKKHSHKWMLEKCGTIRDVIDVIENSKRKLMVEKVLRSFETRVLSKRSDFRQGLIHGDFNENNIIVQKINNEQYKLEGVIDFGDVNYSFAIFDLAITITYMLIHSGQIETGAFVLAGYKDVRKDLTDAEKSILNICVQARLCQSLVNGLYAYSQDPGNEYVLSSQKTGWDILEKLYAMDDDKVLRMWDSKN
ncbi:hydroxylysine kinase [Culicoides brevitarsis]|uniref:hydroxylysine kinase n=1 Tax=Culicoides brevitarsis TaxID=469753 RepID=UPI00307B7154